jgi:hypothetical protein
MLERGARGAGLVAAVALVAALVPAWAQAASCCGGGGGAAAMAGRGERGLLDLGVEAERYDGYFDGHGQHLPDPVGSALAQYRLTAAAAVRLASAWQVGLSVPIVWNDNVYGGGGLSSRTRGVGDASVSLWFEAVDQRTAWRLASPADLVPAITVGATLTVPTGISPYDDVASSFDVTGRGFYRLDGTVLVDKGYRAWSASLALAYGVAFERPVNRSYGGFIPPERRDLGDRTSASLAVGHRLFVGTGGHALTSTASLSWLREGMGTATTGLEKAAVSVTLAWSSTDSDWSARTSWAHTLQLDGWGRSFPTTDTFTLGVRRAFR